MGRQRILVLKEEENMPTSILDIEGVGPAFAAKLKEAGIGTVEALLAQGASPKGREEIVAKTGIDHAKILKWVNHADLFRIKGVASEYSDLLEAAGVDSPVELAHRKAEHLTAKMVAINAEKKLVRKLPVEKQVANWIEQAKKMPKVVTH
jgi:predicted flap endonuclease-1-like 5' DNA nuclease